MGHHEELGLWVERLGLLVGWRGRLGVESCLGYREGQGLPSHSKHVVSLARSIGPPRVMRSWVWNCKYVRV